MTPPETLARELADRYRLERQLGQGGMATVYLAHDVRHDRQVALKVLRPELAAVIGAERFLAEIKTTANLQHPHILPLFDSGKVDGTVFYVMPFVAGESLRDRLGRERQLPIDEAIRITREVASALDYAHRQGVVHRDVKPENILLHDGQALVADFGIALAASRADGTGRLTETGMSLGTPHYMSPEQALGERTVDARTDVYALGCMLYEMLVGEPPFTGATAQAVLAKVMTERPQAPSVTRDTVPAGVEAAVLTALAKLPVDRFPTAAAFAEALTKPGDRPAARAARPIGRIVALTAAVALAAGVIGDRLVSRSALAVATADAEPRRYSIVLPDSAPLAVNGSLPYLAARSLSVSPDGQRLVYLAETPSGRHLRLLRLDGGPSTDLPHTDNALLPTFSPDGRHIAFISGGAVQRLSLEDQSLTRLGSAPGWVSGLHWDPDGRVYVTRDSYGGCLRAMAETGGAEEDIGKAACDAQALGKRLPGTDWLLSHAYRSLAAVSTRTGVREQILLTTGEQKRSVGGTNPMFIPDGNLVFVRDSTVYGVPFDPSSLTLKGEPKPLFTGIRREAGVGQVQWGLTASGTLVWVPGGDLGLAHLGFLDLTGLVDTVFGPPSNYEGVTLSPDGRRIGVQRNLEGERSIAILDLARRVEDEVAMPGPLILMYWLRSGRGMPLASGMSWAYAVPSAVVDTAGRVSTDSTDTNLLDESPDGLLQCGNRDGGFALWPRRKRDSLVRLDDPAFICHFSPDGKWVAWSKSDGAFGAPVEARGPAARIQISANALEFHWSPDARQIIYPWGQAFYRQRLPVRTGERPEPHQLLLKAHYLDTPGPATGGGPDGRILAILAPKAPAVTRLEVMTNFPTFVARKLRAANP